MAVNVVTALKYFSAHASGLLKSIGCAAARDPAASRKTSTAASEQWRLFLISWLVDHVLECAKYGPRIAQVFLGNG